MIAAFTGISGVNDGGNLIGTYLSSTSIRPRVTVGLLLASILAGPIIFGTRVSHTIAVEIVNFQAAGHSVLALSLLAAVLTLGVTWRMSIPTSTTMALAGGMVGTALAAGHMDWIRWAGVLKVSIGLVGSVLVGFGMAFALASLLWMLMRRYPRLGFSGGRAQAATIVLQGLAYGANDQEKAIGFTAVFLMWSARHTAYHVSWLAILLPWVFWLAGFFGGGLRIARTVSGHVVRLNDVGSMSTQLSAAITVGAASLMGFPVSTTQTTDGSLFGTGAALKPYHVRWHTVGKFAKVWALTLPLAVAMGMATMGGARLLGGL